MPGEPQVCRAEPDRTPGGAAAVVERAEHGPIPGRGVVVGAAEDLTDGAVGMEVDSDVQTVLERRAGDKLLHVRDRPPPRRLASDVAHSTILALG
jgi:hypothetical protein